MFRLAKFGAIMPTTKALDSNTTVTTELALATLGYVTQIEMILCHVA
jgi:hypothetical protein